MKGLFGILFVWCLGCYVYAFIKDIVLGGAKKHDGRQEPDDTLKYIIFEELDDK